jgi:hypothetical protein
MKTCYKILYAIDTLIGVYKSIKSIYNLEFDDPDNKLEIGRNFEICGTAAGDIDFYKETIN